MKNSERRVAIMLRLNTARFSVMNAGIFAGQTDATIRR